MTIYAYNTFLTLAVNCIMSVVVEVILIVAGHVFFHLSLINSDVASLFIYYLIESFLYRRHLAEYSSNTGVEYY